MKFILFLFSYMEIVFEQAQKFKKKTEIEIQLINFISRN